MSDEIKPVDGAEPVETPTPAPVRTRRARVGWFEPEIYIEDIVDKVPNKYLAVNVAARRARELNQMSLPVGERAKEAQKPTTQALLELMEGVLTYETVAMPTDELAVPVDLDEAPDEEVVSLFGDLVEAEEEAEDLDITDFEDVDDDMD